jgi:hypothetical protein
MQTYRMRSISPSIIVHSPRRILSAVDTIQADLVPTIVDA